MFKKIYKSIDMLTLLPMVYHKLSLFYGKLANFTILGIHTFHITRPCSTPLKLAIIFSVVTFLNFIVLFQKIYKSIDILTLLPMVYHKLSLFYDKLANFKFSGIHTFHISRPCQTPLKLAIIFSVVTFLNFIILFQKI